jgi:hypothetical protein
MQQLNRKTGFHIGVTCPGCGADLELQDDFFSVQCSFCGSVLRLVMPETAPVYYVPMKMQKRELRFQVDRHLKNTGQPLTGAGLSYKVVYYPYWKIDAVKLQVKLKRQENISQNTNSNILTTQLHYHGVFVTGRVVGNVLTAKPSNVDNKELTVRLSPYSMTRNAADEVLGIPPSLGQRTDCIKMYPMSAGDHDISAQYIPIDKSWEATARQAGDSVGLGKHTGEPGCLARELLFPEGSIVYFPFAVFEHNSRDSILQRIVCDGVVGRVLSVVSPSNELIEECHGETSLIDYGQVLVTEHRCKNCGTDLPASSSSVYVCRNCHIAVSIDNNVTLNEGIFRASDSDNNGRSDIQLFPFWSFRAPKKLINDFVKSYYHIDNSENIIVPAFTFSNFDAMRRLTKRVTASGQTLNIQPIDDLDQRFLAAPVGLQKAHRMAEITLYCAQASQKTKLSIDDFNFPVEDARLIYIPFSCENYFYISTVNDAITFEKRAYRPIT